MDDSRIDELFRRRADLASEHREKLARLLPGYPEEIERIEREAREALARMAREQPEEFARMMADPGGSHTAMVEASPDPPVENDESRAREREHAQRVLAELERAKGADARYVDLPDATMAAYTLARFEDARALAMEALELAALSQRGWNHGNAVHYAHTVLGLLALDEGRVDEALSQLDQSGATDGSPQLNSFGPSMRLAKALLKRGERDAILRYFEQCRRFWRSGASTLDIWTAKVQRGAVPYFSHR